MKTFFSTLIFMVLFISFGSCKENEYEGYTGKASVYFQLDPSNWNYSGDSIFYSFVGKNTDEATVQILINLLGNPSPQDRIVKIHVDESLTTAKEGLHYATLQNEYIMKSGEMQISVPIIVYKKDEGLNSKAVVLALQLDESADFDLQFPNRTTAKLFISNIISKPSYWDSSYLTWTFGTYSNRLMEIIVMIAGRTMPETASKYNEEKQFWNNVATLVKQYLTDNYPVYDENGNIIN
ncbi:MAG: DUF4843 domain-containing protein [Prevotella sp.]|nr:DUF4843 domain-containing protein [Prevotella sp.]